jgi:hypothetical protein
MAANPPDGAILDYLLPTGVRGPVTLTVRNAQGQLVRSFSSAEKFARPDPAKLPIAPEWVPVPMQLSTAPGMHRFVWNLRYPRPHAIEYGYSIAATWDSDTPLTPEGPLVLPGNYQVVLHADGKDYRAPLTVTMDPREHVATADLAAGLAFSRRIGDSLQQVWSNYGEVQSLRKQLGALHTKLAGDAARKPLLAAVDALDAKTKPLVSGSGEYAANLHAMSDALTAIATDVEGADRAPTDGQQQALAEYDANLGKALAQWQSIRGTDLPQLDRQLQAAHLPAVTLAAATPTQPDGDDDADMP